MQGKVHVSIHACTNDYLRCTKCEVQNHVHKYVIRGTKKGVPKFLIFEALNYLNASFSFTSSRAQGNLFKKKYEQKKHFVSEEENNYEEETNLTPQDIANINWCKCGCECKPMTTLHSLLFH